MYLDTNATVDCSMRGPLERTSSIFFSLNGEVYRGIGEVLLGKTLVLLFWHISKKIDLVSLAAMKKDTPPFQTQEFREKMLLN